MDEVQGLGPSREAALGTWWGLGRSLLLACRPRSYPDVLRNAVPEFTRLAAINPPSTGSVTPVT